jgi:lysozyme
MKIGSRIWIPEKINKNYLPSCVSEKGKEDIKKFEKFSEGPYKDPAHGDTWSIGYGHQIDLEKILLRLLKKRLWNFSERHKNVEDVIRENGWVELSGKEYDALASFVYNVGVENFKNSTLLKLLNEEDYANAMDEFPKWIKSGGEVVPGLTPRRDYERSKCFLG